MNSPTLWRSIESCLDRKLPQWRGQVCKMGQLEAVEARCTGQPWSDDEVFEALLMAVLSANTDWSKIERIQRELADLFCEFSLDWYAGRSPAEVKRRFLPWFEDKERRAGSMSLKDGLTNLIRAARILLKYSRTHRTADGYFTSLLDRCRGDPKEAALRLGCEGPDKLPAFGVPLAAEALKNLGFDVAKPDRHIMRAVGSFGLVHFSRWTDAKDGRARPVSSSKGKLLAVMEAVQAIAEAANKRVVLVDNAIWLLCAKSRLHLTNRQLAELAPEGEPPEDRAAGLGTLIQSWMDEGSAAEQRETMEHLVRALDEDRRSDRKLFPRALKGKSW